MPKVRDDNTPKKKFSPQTYERARVVKQIKDDNPGCLYSECMRRLKKQLGIGKSAAEQAMACYHQQLHEWIHHPKRGEEVLDSFMRISRKAEDKGQYGAASSALSEARDMMGLKPVEKIEHSGHMSLEHAHTQALRLTPAQRKARVLELTAKRDAK